MRKDIKASCQKRLSRIEGQVRGLSKMVDEDRYCIDIVTQIGAVRAALRKVEEEVLRDHVGHCVEGAIASGSRARQRRKGGTAAAIRIKRAYDPPEAGDGLRILIDRLWPRGMPKSKLKLDAWAKHLSPSNELRKWYRHDPDKFTEFRKRYLA